MKRAPMLLQYPKLNNIPDLTYEDYRKLHFEFMKAYKALYNDVAAFAVLPENFIKEAEPVINNYFEQQAKVKSEEARDNRMQLISEFMGRFNEFMDEAAEMFTAHQTLADKTMNYLAHAQHVEEQIKVVEPALQQQYYLNLLPFLEELVDRLNDVREVVSTTTADLEILKPIWCKIQKQL